MKEVVLGFVFCCVAAANGVAQTAAELLERVDRNENYGSIVYDGRMLIDYNGKRFVKTMKAWARGNSDSFIEFTNREDAGTKYLKKDGRLYVYSPDTEEVMLISGHMLKESMMGSDMSYEDAVENETLSARYTPVLAAAAAGPAVIGEKECWVLDLTAKRRTESYPRQRLWIEKATGDLVRYELFALSGAKLKEYTLLRVELIGNRRFPVEMEIRDLLRKGSKTTVTMSNVTLDQPVADSVFTTRNLER
ncbi:MAG: outer membrane lipoprotein-sorting protein [Spirochaetaceae bacterium]|jgi:outer membrane lipoprotein-sorting protein|nr:outer membrane lipoprotein-sorting protein [Spirochaetaceae bacterium]